MSHRWRRPLGFGAYGMRDGSTVQFIFKRRRESAREQPLGDGNGIVHAAFRKDWLL